MAGLGVGLIGTGYMGKCHALAWNNVAAIFGDVARPRLVRLAERNSALAEARAREFGFAKATSDWRDLLVDPDVDVVSVTTPNQFHADMAIAALEAGKHVWCEKPMATALADAERMEAAARRSGKVAVIGYNYIQNPVMRHLRTLLGQGAIGKVNHVRIEMDEDFMADPEAPFSPKSEAKGGYGALDDFAVHPLSLLWNLFGHVEAVIADLGKPYPDRPLSDGGRRAVENHDQASVLMRLSGGIPAVLMANRAAWGRKGRIALQIFGSHGSILFDQERMNEFQLYRTSDPATEQGFATVLTAPHHKPYDRFIPAPGHSLGFNDLKVIECRELMAAIAGEPFRAVDFANGLRIERAVHAMAQSFRERRWVEVAAG
ncbi:Gfo/Idh/MocA family protein [Mycoplana ramosa]|uniref:Gfo/Idh/MocA family protein n=1 Tax=Mycoplana ramosa TaxID=40837 RepID=A0ABW3YU26_MYCRA